MAKKNKADKHYKVSGKITKNARAIRTSVNKLTVKCFQVEFGQKEHKFLGEATTDKAGQYTIDYPIQKGISKLNIIVKVYADATQKKTLSSSSIRFKVKEEEIIDIPIQKSFSLKKSNFTQLEEQLKPIVKKESINKLAGSEITILAGETGVTHGDIIALVKANQLAKDIKDIDADIFYGLSKQNLPLDKTELLFSNHEDWKWAFDKAIETGDISVDKKGGGEKDKIISTLEIKRLELIKKQTPLLLRPDYFYQPTKALANKSRNGVHIRGRLNTRFKTALFNIAGSVKEPMEWAIKTILEELTYEGFEKKTLNSVFKEEVIGKLEEQNPELLREITQLKSRFNHRDSETVSAILHLDKSLKDNPILAKDIRFAKTYAIAKIAKIEDEGKQKILLQYSSQLDSNLSGTLDLLSADKKNGLKEEEITKIRQISNLFRLTNDHKDAVKKLYIGDGRVKEIRELISWDKNTFKEFYGNGNNNISVPKGFNENQYFESLERKIDKAFPWPVLKERITRVFPDKINKQTELEELAATVLKNLNLNLPTHVNSTAFFTNIFKYSGIKEALKDNNNKFPKTKINRFFNDLKRFFDKNKDLDIRAINFLDKKEMEKLKLVAETQKNVKKQLMAFQRMMHITDNAQDRLTLMGNGFDNSFSIATKTKRAFIAECGLDEKKAIDTRNKCIKEADKLVNMQMRMHEITNTGATPAMVNIPRHLTNELMDSTTYEELFGKQDYCACEHCRSILSPAAYFVDLMSFIEDHISEPVFIEQGRENSGIYLKNRRSDLWSLELSCENTHTEIPYLDVVLEVLENYLLNIQMLTLALPVENNDNDIIKFSENELLEWYKKNALKLKFNLSNQDIQHIGEQIFNTFKNEITKKIDKAQPIWSLFLIALAGIDIGFNPRKKIKLKEIKKVSEEFIESNTEINNFQKKIIQWYIIELEKQPKKEFNFEEIKNIKFKSLFKDTLTASFMESKERFLTSFQNAYTEITNSNIYKKLSLDSEKISFSLPFNQPLEEIRTYIEHFKLTLFDIYHLLQPEADKTWIENLKLSTEEYAAITTQDTAGIFYRFGKKERETFSKMEVQEFLRYTGLKRDELDEILKLRFNKYIFKNIKIKRERIENEFQNYKEVLNNLSKVNLDFFYRFIKLWKKSGLKIKELDILLFALKDRNKKNSSAEKRGDLPNIIPLAKLLYLKEKLKLTVEETCAMVGLLPTSEEYPKPPKKEKDRGLYERLFDLKAIFGENNPLEGVLNEEIPYSETQLPLIIAGLGISETEFLHLSKHLNGSDENIKLNKEYLSLLFRHARLAKALKWSVFELVQALEVLFIAPTKNVVNNLQKIFDLLALKTWLKETPFKIDELHFILKDTDGERSDKYKLTREVLEAWVLAIDKEPSLTLEQFQALAFSVNNKYADLNSKEKEEKNNVKEHLKTWTEANKKLIKNLALKKQLFSFYNIACEDLTQLLEKRIIAEIETKFGNAGAQKKMTPDSWLENWGIDSYPTESLFPVKMEEKKDADSNSEKDEFGQVLKIPKINEENVIKLLSYAKGMERHLYIFEKLKWEETTSQYVTNNHKLLAVDDLKTINREDIRKFSLYTNLIKLTDEAETKVNTFLENLKNEKGFDSTLFAELWTTPQELIKSIHKTLDQEESILLQLDKLKKRLDIAKKLGVNGQSLQKLSNNDSYDLLLEARDIILGAFSSRYPDEEERKEKLTPYHDIINGIKRDILCDYILAREPELKFKDKSDLSAFFLLDIEMGDCDRISRVVAANSSLQWYVHRVLIDLEKGTLATGGISVQTEMGEDNLVEMEQEWIWRKNYRVWEANRKVFLYPENYIEPDLRDDKTPQFSELEDNLLQQQISKETATESVAIFLTKLAQLSSLTIAGTFFDNQKNTYYFVGRTRLSPYRFYYRTLFINQFEEEKWTSWFEIPIPINTTEVGIIIKFGRLYLFWIDITHKEINSILGGNMTTSSINFTLTLKYSYLNQNNSWTTVQNQKIGEQVSPLNAISELTSIPISDDNKEIVISKYKNTLISRPYPFYDNNGLESSLIDIYFLWKVKFENERRGKFRKFSSFLGETIEDVFIKNESPLIRIKSNFHEGIITENIESFLNDISIIINNGHPQLKSIYIPKREHYGPSPKGIILQGFAVIKRINFGNARIGVIKFNIHPTTGMYGVLTINNDGTSLLKVQDIPVTIELISTLPINPYYPHKLELESNSKIKISFETDAFLFNDIETFDYTENKISNLKINLLANRFSGEVGLLNTSIKVLEDTSILTQEKNSINSTEKFIHNGLRNYSDANRKIIYSESTNELLLWKNEEYENINGINFDNLSENLILRGVDNMLSLESQDTNDSFNQKIDFNTAFSIYYRELFFHLPYLVANSLNANHKFKEAKWWYERIFDPTAPESDVENTQNRSWQYIEFRKLQKKSMYEILTGIGVDQGASNKLAEAMSTYKEDPFNPHAIARLRLSAYQRSIVMKYIDNLLDWGDHLFGQDTRESINEATMLYILASDILGKRPVQLGKCEAPKGKLNYDTIKPEMQGEFLSVFENYSYLQNTSVYQDNPKVEIKFSDEMLEKLKPIPVDNNGNEILGTHLPLPSSEGVKFNGEFVKYNVLGFCIPNNKDLLAYWNRVDDRLFKIRNCRNLSGVERSLSLFQPPIDPMLLVRAKATGLSLEEAVQLALNQEPSMPYRFIYLLEKTRQFTQVVQSFGNTLLSALEKKDIEALTLLRSVHEQIILNFTTQLRLKQISETESQLLGLQKTKVNIDNRISHFTNLLDEELIQEEEKQQNLKKQAGSFEETANQFRIEGSHLRIMPQVGAPTAMTYGGQQLGHSMDMYAGSFSATARKLTRMAETTGVEASYKRREQDWKFQQKSAKLELKQIEKQILAADIRIDIAKKEKENHEKNVAHSKEMYDLYKDKFTNLGLYNYLSTKLNRLHTQAYNMALKMAKTAELAYQFELDDQSYFIKNDNWDSQKAGLLSGERLLLQLQQMEQSYMEKNVRQPEITQSFSMRQIAPERLLDLKAEGECKDFTIPEAAYDLIYAGHYKRLIKSVRISIPCVVGPYTNIGCTLSLIDARVKTKPSLDGDNEKRMPPGSIIIATSNGQNDGGQFELNFRDERYLPFEGAGAISTWSLELPQVRSFDYNTISDVIFHISYTSKYEGGLFKDAINNQLQDNINQLGGKNLQRLFSLKHDFPQEWNQFNSSDPQKKFEAKIGKNYFPYWAQGMEIELKKAKVLGVGIKERAYKLIKRDDAKITPPKLTTEIEETSLTIPKDSLKEEEEIKVKDWFVVVEYSVSKLE